MPWCEPCEKNWTPTSVSADGVCPDCGVALVCTPGVDHDPQEAPPAPWHFWVGVVAAGAYLLWRAFEGVLLLF